MAIKLRNTPELRGFFLYGRSAYNNSVEGFQKRAA